MGKRKILATGNAPVVVHKNHNHPIKTFLKGLFVYNTNPEQPRIWELDLFRGLLMLFVTFDHMSNFGTVFGIFNFQTEFGMWVLNNIIVPYRDGAFRVGIQPFGLFMFSLLSGISCSLTHNNGKRLLKMLVFCAVFMGVFAVLHIFMPDVVHSYFIFNIINVLTICVLVWYIFDLIKCPKWIRMCVGLATMAVGLTYYYMYFVRGGCYVDNEVLSLLVYNSHPEELVQNFEPLCPNLGFFLIGGVLGSALYKEKKTATKSKKCLPILVPMALMGKNSLVTYLLLPEILLGIIWAIERIVWLFI